MNRNIKTKQQGTGFTIIEILIVLAIAGLILLIVFLAVPALQRNSRNTGRRTDISRIAGAVNEYVTNNTGTLPCPGGTTFAASGATILTSAGTLGQYTFTAADGGADTDGKFTCTNVGAQNALAAGSNEARLVEGATCDAANPGKTVAATSPKAMALQFTLESGGGTPTGSCIST